MSPQQMVDAVAAAATTAVNSEQVRKVAMAHPTAQTVLVDITAAEAAAAGEARHLRPLV